MNALSPWRSLAPALLSVLRIVAAFLFGPYTVGRAEGTTGIDRRGRLKPWPEVSGRCRLSAEPVP